MRRQLDSRAAGSGATPATACFRASRCFHSAVMRCTRGMRYVRRMRGKRSMRCVCLPRAMRGWCVACGPIWRLSRRRCGGFGGGRRGGRRSWRVAVRWFVGRL